MSIAYVGQSHAKSGESGKLREFLLSVVLPAIRSLSGCESCLMGRVSAFAEHFFDVGVARSQR